MKKDIDYYDEKFDKVVEEELSSAAFEKMSD